MIGETPCALTTLIPLPGPEGPERGRGGGLWCLPPSHAALARLNDFALARCRRSSWQPQTYRKTPQDAFFSPWFARRAMLPGGESPPHAGFCGAGGNPRSGCAPTTPIPLPGPERPGRGLGETWAGGRGAYVRPMRRLARLIDFASARCRSGTCQ